MKQLWKKMFETFEVPSVSLTCGSEKIAPPLEAVWGREGESP
jgi:hypothetical protein